MSDRGKSWHLRNWNMAELRYELAYQQSDGIHTYGPGQCGHVARGSGCCAKCLQREIDPSDDLRHIASGCAEVADWLDKRAERDGA